MNGSRVSTLHEALITGDSLSNEELNELFDALNFLIDYNIGVGNKLHVRSYVQDQNRITEILKSRKAK